MARIIGNEDEFVKWLSRAALVVASVATSVIADQWAAVFTSGAWRSPW